MRVHRILSLSAILCVISLPLAAQKTHIDYDGATAFNKYRTFQFQEARKDLRRVSPSLHNDVVEQLRDYMVAGGLTEVREGPDIYVTYFVAREGNLKLALTDLGYAYGPQFSPGSYWEGGVAALRPRASRAIITRTRRGSPRRGDIGPRPG